MIELPNVTALYVFLAFGICYWILKKYLFVPLSAILDGRVNARSRGREGVRREPADAREGRRGGRRAALRGAPRGAEDARGPDGPRALALLERQARRGPRGVACVDRARQQGNRGAGLGAPRRSCPSAPARSPGSSPKRSSDGSSRREREPARAPAGGPSGRSPSVRRGRARREVPRAAALDLAAPEPRAVHRAAALLRRQAAGRGLPAAPGRDRERGARKPRSSAPHVEQPGRGHARAHGEGRDARSRRSASRAEPTGKRRARPSPRAPTRRPSGSARTRGEEIERRLAAAKAELRRTAADLTAAAADRDARARDHAGRPRAPARRQRRPAEGAPDELASRTRTPARSWKPRRPATTSRRFLEAGQTMAERVRGQPEAARVPARAERPARGQEQGDRRARRQGGAGRVRRAIPPGDAAQPPPPRGRRRSSRPCAT